MQERHDEAGPSTSNVRVHSYRPLTRLDDCEGFGCPVVRYFEKLLFEIGSDHAIDVRDCIEIGFVANTRWMFPLHVSFFVRSRVDANTLVRVNSPALQIENRNVVVILGHQSAGQKTRLFIAHGRQASPPRVLVNQGKRLRRYRLITANWSSFSL
jgi:hypothetical protein